MPSEPKQLPKTRPIDFTGPMVRAILEGRKKQTRRIVKPQPGDKESITNAFGGWHVGRMRDSENAWRGLKCPYGPGERLRVRETWGSLDDAIGTAKSDPGTRALIDGCFYAADYFPHEEIVSRWRPSTNMPRWASRITLIVKSVRVERVQDITEDDALSEGMSKGPALCPRMEFSRLWDSIHGGAFGEFAWGANPWVWAIDFEREAVKA